ncbi:acyltransferase, partial [Streptomyces sp. TRM76130]|nr:acyltransferase [Streptomyces sp. TRM76130]
MPPGARRPATPRPGPRPGFRPDIEGLRALAIGLVLLYHAGAARLAGGYVGVDVFFVISGFLITGLLVRELERTGRVSLTGFYARRMRRLLPSA